MNDVLKDLKQVIDWLQLRNDGLGDIPHDLDLIDNRLIDSLSFMEFILLLESLIGRDIPVEELDIDQFRTLKAIEVNFLQPSTLENQA